LALLLVKQDNLTKGWQTPRERRKGAQYALHAASIDIYFSPHVQRHPASGCLLHIRTRE
jgi:hypothetical protein